MVINGEKHEEFGEKADALQLYPPCFPFGFT